MTILENHLQDSRIKKTDVFQSLSQKMGTCGNNAPFVICRTNKYRKIVEDELFPSLMTENCAKYGFAYNNVLLAQKQPHFAVRRITPLECCRLQGFPDWWAKDLKFGEEDFPFFKKVFDERSQMFGRKRKQDSQIRRWMANPHSDTAEYRMWGNGVALPCVDFVMKQIKEFA